MKKVLLFLLVMCALHVTWAYDFSATAPSGQTLYFRITSSSSPLTVEVSYPGSSINNPWLDYTEPIGSLSIPSSVSHEGNDYSVTSIGEYTFQNCSSLTSVTIPNSVTSITRNAFDGCSSLTSVTIPNSVTTIGNYAFRNCSSLTSVTMPNSVTTIGTYLFNNCTSLTSITISNTLESIEASMFNGCTSLVSVTIPNSVTSIGMAAFFGCSSLASIIIPNAVNSIGTGVFSGCSSLASIVVDNDNATFDSRDNCNAIIKKENNELAHGCKNTIIPNSVTSIGTYAFNQCSSLTSMTIPNSVTNIAGNAFSGCTSLKTIYNLSELSIETNSYGFSVNRVVIPTKFGAGNNALYEIPTTYSFVDAETGVETEIPLSTIPTNFIYNDNGWKAKNIILTDNQDEFEAPETFTAASATYTRDFTNTNRSTLYLPFSASAPTDLKVYDFTSFANNTLSFTEHSGNIAAYTPYLVDFDLSAKDGSTTNCTISATNVTFPKSESANYNSVTSDGMTFLGVIERTTMSSTSNYGYDNGNFLQSNGSAQVDPFRCYFTYNNPPASLPSVLNVEIVNGEVGIEEVETIDTPNVSFYSTDVYDMMGRIIRRNAENLNGLPKGIYIWKGQKVVHINY